MMEVMLYWLAVGENGVGLGRRMRTSGWTSMGDGERVMVIVWEGGFWRRCGRVCAVGGGETVGKV